MTQISNFDENMNINNMDPAQKQKYLKALTTGRDPKTGRFLKEHSGNLKGRPREKTNMSECLNKVFALRTSISINGKKVKTTMLQAYCYKLMASTLASDDIKLLVQTLKIFGPMINLYEELPKPKTVSYEDDPSVKEIKKAIYKRLDDERDQNMLNSKDFIN